MFFVYVSPLFLVLHFQHFNITAFMKLQTDPDAYSEDDSNLKTMSISGIFILVYNCIELSLALFLYLSSSLIFICMHIAVCCWPFPPSGERL